MCMSIVVADQSQRMSESSGLHGGHWDEPEFEFDDIGFDLAAAARPAASGKTT